MQKLSPVKASLINLQFKFVKIVTVTAKICITSGAFLIVTTNAAWINVAWSKHFCKIVPQMKFQYWPKSKLVWPLEYQGGIFREAPKNLQNISWNINVFVDSKQTRMYEARQNKTINVLKLKFSPEFQRKDWIKWKDIFLLLKFIYCQRKNFLQTWNTS